MSHYRVIKVTNCTDCPFAHDYKGQGECWKECTHPDLGRDAYGNILWGCREVFTKVPVWCPFGIGATHAA
jgi:hypothetical protein